jgi:low affinity Fe/Cu permease
MSTSSTFRRFAAGASSAAGKPATFLAAVLIVLVWAGTGPLFHFGDTWQLVINTGTTIITFLMVFLIQNTQNRDGAAVQITMPCSIWKSSTTGRWSASGSTIAGWPTRGAASWTTWRRRWRPTPTDAG